MTKKQQSTTTMQQPMLKTLATVIFVLSLSLCLTCSDARYWQRNSQSIFPPRVDPILHYRNRDLRSSDDNLHQSGTGLDYDDFGGDVSPFQKRSYFFDQNGQQVEVGGERDFLSGTKTKRYLGIDIPDYISGGGKSGALKSMSDKMKAMGKK